MNPSSAHANGAHDEEGEGTFRPTYVTTLGDFYPKLLANYRKLDPIEFSDGALRTILQEAEQRVGPLPRDALRDALRAGHEALKRSLVGEANGGRYIQNLRGLTKRILIERLEEARCATD